tara:strand:+ start:250 stop:621 length:372 start_codon:yes stop_codon:yes gene_type:complete
MKRILTLYFTYKPIRTGFEPDQYIPFTTTVLEDGDEAEYEYTKKWISNILHERLKLDADISSFVITETVETDEEAGQREDIYGGFVEHNAKHLKQPEGTVIQVDFSKKTEEDSKDGPDSTKDN